MSVIQPILHYSLHFLFPFLIAWFFYREKWLKAGLIMVSTMLVDLDHLLANPIFDPNRCSINFHFLHTYWAIGFYVILLLFPKARIVAIGLLFHMLTDFEDCLWIQFC
jgi:hypothetical protein